MKLEDKILKLRKEGLSFGEIAEKLGISRGKTYYLYKKAEAKEEGYKIKERLRILEEKERRLREKESEVRKLESEIKALRTEIEWKEKIYKPMLEKEIELKERTVKFLEGRIKELREEKRNLEENIWILEEDIMRKNKELKRINEEVKRKEEEKKKLIDKITEFSIRRDKIIEELLDNPEAFNKFVLRLIEIGFIDPLVRNFIEKYGERKFREFQQILESSYIRVMDRMLQWWW